MMSDAKQLAKWIEQASQEFCEEGGGQPYPDEAEELCGYVVVAAADPAKEYCRAQLEIYTPEDVSEWVAAIREWFREYPDATVFEAVNETIPA